MTIEHALHLIGVAILCSVGFTMNLVVGWCVEENRFFMAGRAGVCLPHRGREQDPVQGAGIGLDDLGTVVFS